MRENVVLTIPGVKHISDEVVYEGDLRFGHAAGVPVKHWHHHRQALSLLLIRLQGEHRQRQIAMKGQQLMHTRAKSAAWNVRGHK